MENDKQIVLIVDDSRTNILSLAELLKKDWTVKVASNGKAALRIASTLPQPDIILLDIMMPGMDGYEVCKILKDTPETRDIPVIFVTAMNQEKDEEYGLNLGAIDFIVKPYSPSLVKARVKNHLELKKYRDMLKEFSMLDGLTRIANRRRFDDYLKAEWGRALRNKNTLSLIMTDIDYFKNYNDTYGHLEGDDCLRKVAKALQEGAKRSADLVARWGGEEFACLFPETEKETAAKIAEEMRNSVSSLKIPHKTSPIGDYVTISLGVSTLIPGEETTLDTLVEQADRALYDAKESGRNKVFMII